MAIWMSFPKARKLPNVRSEQAYKANGAFLRAVRVEAAGSAVWARRKTGFGGMNLATLEVDITAIPGVVPALRTDGSRVS